MFEQLPTLLTADSGPVLGGILLVVYATITSLRKRRDTSIAELEKRVAALETQIATMTTEHAAELVAASEKASRAEQKAMGYETLLIGAQRDRFALRSVLADKGWPDPTMNPQA